MLSVARVEGEGLGEVFRSFLANNGAMLDWSLYEEQAPRTRTFLIEVSSEHNDEPTRALVRSNSFN